MCFKTNRFIVCHTMELEHVRNIIIIISKFKRLFKSDKLTGFENLFYYF